MINTFSDFLEASGVNTVMQFAAATIAVLIFVWGILKYRKSKSSALPAETKTHQTLNAPAEGGVVFHDNKIKKVSVHNVED